MKQKASLNYGGRITKTFSFTVQFIAFIVAVIRKKSPYTRWGKLPDTYKKGGYKNQTLIFEAKIRNETPQINAKIRYAPPKLLLLKEIKFTHTTELFKKTTQREKFTQK